MTGRCLLRDFHKWGILKTPDQTSHSLDTFINSSIFQNPVIKNGRWLEGDSWETFTKWGISQDSWPDIPFPRHFHKFINFPKSCYQEWKVTGRWLLRDFHKWGISQDSWQDIPFPRHFHKFINFQNSIINNGRWLEGASWETFTNEAFLRLLAIHSIPQTLS